MVRLSGVKSFWTALIFAGFSVFGGTVAAQDLAEDLLAQNLANVLTRERTAIGSSMVERVIAMAVQLPEPGRANNAIPGFGYENRYLASLPAASGGDAWYCLTEALYFEARGESARGLFAVAEVILNRVESPRFPSSVCSVVNQGTGRRFQCQFSYTCDGRAENVNEPAAWVRVGKVARIMIDGAERPLTAGATFYHTLNVRPSWAARFPVTANIGAHRFYRHPGDA